MPATTPLPRLIRLENRVMEYSWGSPDAIPALCGRPNPTGAPWAELWIGAHPRGPSTALLDSGPMPLDALIAAEPAAVLGTVRAEAGEHRLPFLFKVLAAEHALSIQAHPDAAQALAGFEREELLRIPIDDPERCYRDASPKPELIVALTPFVAMKGFREPREIVELLGAAGGGALAPERRILEGDAGPDGLRDFLRAMLTLAPERRERAVNEAREGPVGAWVARLASDHPDDAGALAPLYLRVHELRPGEALFLEARELHAYVRGTALELMANSDNVLRGGLTRKHKDVAELLRVLRFAPDPRPPLSPLTSPDGALVYAPPEAPFALAKVAPGRDSRWVEREAEGPRIVLVTDGAFTAASAGARVALRRGDTLLVPAASRPLALEGRGVAWIASTGRAAALPRRDS